MYHSNRHRGSIMTNTVWLHDLLGKAKGCIISNFCPATNTTPFNTTGIENVYNKYFSSNLNCTTYSPSDPIHEKMNSHAFRAAKDIYQPMRSKKIFYTTADDDNCANGANCAEESRWIQTTDQSEGDGTLVDWGLREVGDVLYLSFRGTDGDEITDILTDIAVVYGSMNFGKGETFKIHLGFKNFVDEEFEKILKGIEDTIQLYTKERKKKCQYRPVRDWTFFGGRCRSGIHVTVSVPEKASYCCCVHSDIRRTSSALHSLKRWFQGRDFPLCKVEEGMCELCLPVGCGRLLFSRSGGNLEKMDGDFNKTLVWLGKKTYALFQAYICGDKKNLHAEFLTLAKGFISQVVNFANLDYLKKFEAVSGTTVLLYHPDENTGAEFNKSLGHKFAFHKLNHDHSKNFNSLALESDLHQFFAKYMESITLKYHRLESYERAMEKLCSNVCPTATNNASSSP